MTDREPGYYWVEWRGWNKRTMAYWSEIKRWLVPGQEAFNLDSDAVEIFERIDRDETERLKARVAELEAALEPFSDEATAIEGKYGGGVHDGMAVDEFSRNLSMRDLRRARTALKGSE